VAAVKTDTEDLQARIGTPVIDVSSDLSAISLAVSGIEADTNDLQSRVPAALESGRIAATISADIVEGSVTYQEALRLANAANAGKLSGAGTTDVTIRDLADTKDRVAATVDASGNRTAVTLDLT
jgi:hypothetical protein